MQKPQRSLSFSSLVPLPLLLSFLAVSGCNTAYGEPSTPSLLASSSYGGSSSSGASSFSGPSGPSIPSHGDARGGLLVRPDLVCVPFVLRVEQKNPQASIDLLEQASQAIKTRFGAATGGRAETRMLGASVSPGSDYAKAKKEEAAPNLKVTVDGAVEVPFDAKADYWARAKLVSALVEASQKPGTLLPTASGGEGAPQIEVAFGSPEIKVRDPESFRPELVKRWVERARAFARVAESDKAPLHLVSCEPPNAITQTFISMEQVALSLAVSCRIEAVRPAPGP